MIGYVEAPRAWGLTRGMARVLGVDLPGAVMDGWLSRGELAELVERCRICGRSGACTNWLGKTVVAPDLPEFCANKAALEALAPDA